MRFDLGVYVLLAVYVILDACVDLNMYAMPVDYVILYSRYVR